MWRGMRAWDAGVGCGRRRGAVRCGVLVITAISARERLGRPPAELIGELQQEALDLAGGGFVLRCRLEAMRAPGAELETRPPGVVLTEVT